MYHSTQNVILTKLTLWEYSNRMPHFHGENEAEFRIWCAMAHRQGFASVYTLLINMLILGWAEALQSIKCVDASFIYKESSVTRWHESGQSHHNDRAHNIAWICTYGNRLEHIPTLQGQELSQLERATHVVTWVHHTKCIITHIQVDIDIHTSCTMQPHRVRN